MTGRRVPDGTQPHSYDPGDYGRALLGTHGQTPVWYCRCPSTEHQDQGNLARHEVTEHEDGTITVSPSILIYPHGDSPGWHGFLERGVWRSC